MNSPDAEISRRVEDQILGTKPLYRDEKPSDIAETLPTVVESVRVGDETHHHVVDTDGNPVVLVPKSQPEPGQTAETRFSFSHGRTRLIVEHAGEFDSSAEGIMLGALEGAAQVIRGQDSTRNTRRKRKLGFLDTGVSAHTPEAGRRISRATAKLLGEAALVWLLFSGGFVGVHTAKELALDAAGASVEKVGGGWLADKISGGTDPYALNLDMKHNVKLLVTAPVQFVKKAVHAVGDSNAD